MQEIRQERRGLREQLKQKFGGDTQKVDRIAPSLDNPYMFGGNSEFADDPNTSNLYLSNLSPDVSFLFYVIPCLD